MLQGWKAAKMCVSRCYSSNLGGRLEVAAKAAVKVETVVDRSPPNSFWSQFHAAKVTVFLWEQIIQALNLFVQEDRLPDVGSLLPVCIPTSASLPSRFLYMKCVSTLPTDLAVEMVLLQRETVEDGVERTGHAGGTFEQFELADDCKLLAESVKLVWESCLSSGAAKYG